MSEVTPFPILPLPVPLPVPPAPSDDTSRQLAALGDAMRLLAESQKSLIDVLMKSPASLARPGVPQDITGDPGAGGARPAAIVDFSKLSPLQQITVGLRDAKPVGPNALRRPRDPLSAADASPVPISNGAD